MLRANSRLSRRSSADFRAMDRATRRIEELDGILERQLSEEPREEERLKHLRQATGQITRAANDGIQAYRRLSRAVAAEGTHPDADAEDVRLATKALGEARTRLLTALDTASRRYPWAPPWRPETPVDPETPVE